MVMKHEGRGRSRVAWLTIGVLAGISSVVACGGPDRADAGAGTDSGTPTGCCDACSCTITDPLTLQGTVDVNVTNPTPIDVTVTNPVPAAPAARPGFVGLTTAVFDGAGGFAVMNASCNVEYPGSRMCSSTVILDSYPAPEPLADAWVWSRIVAASPSISLNEIGQASTSNPSYGNCSSSLGSAFGSASATFDGTIITAAGDVHLWSCNSTLPVACCGYTP
jgi:hypothetical protein